MRGLPVTFAATEATGKGARKSKQAANPGKRILTPGALLGQNPIQCCLPTPQTELPVATFHMDRFRIKINTAAAAELKGLPAAARNQVVLSIERQLPYQPNLPTRNRKLLRGLVPPWEHLEPTWEIRVGEYRVFYDIDEAARLVHIRAVRHKPPHRTTEEIL